MKARDVQLKLESMKGNPFEYAKEIHKVESYKIDATRERFTLKTDKKTFDRTFEAAEEFFQYFVEPGHKPLKIEKSAEEPEEELSVSTANKKDDALADELITILKSNIVKLQTNKDYINQATCICENVNSIINIQKLKIDMVKQMRKVNQS